MSFNLQDEIDRRCRLPKPTGKPPEFVKIEKIAGERRPTGHERVRIRHKNPGLYEPDPPETHRSQISPKVDFTSVTANILQNGGEAHQNRRFEEWLGRRQQMSQAEQPANLPPAPPAPPAATNSVGTFKKNALMRALVNNMNSAAEYDCEFAGKEQNIKQPITNGPALFPSREDSEIFLLRDTADSTDEIDNSFRFAHHGTKKTVTPRHYSIHCVKDSDFEFQRP